MRTCKVRKANNVKSDFIKKAGELFYIQPRDLVGSARFSFLLPARFAAYKALRLRGWSYPMIGKLMNRDHSSIIHGVKRADYMMEKDPDFADKVKQLTEYRTEAVVLPYVEPEVEENGEDWLEDLIR